MAPGESRFTCGTSVPNASSEIENERAHTTVFPGTWSLQTEQYCREGIRNVLKVFRSLLLYGDIEQHANTRQRHKQRRRRPPGLRASGDYKLQINWPRITQECRVPTSLTLHFAV